MYFVTRITMQGRNVEDSVVDLKKGVNILYGPSNTGKSYVAECIDYLMGNSETRIDDSKGYDTIIMEMDVDGSFLSMRRKLNESKIFVVSEVRGIDSGEYTLNGNNRICKVWLALMGINENHRISTSAHFQKDELSNRAFDHAFVIREEYIYSKNSVLLPTQGTRKTVAKTGLLFMMTGNDYDDGNDYDKPEVHKAKKTAVVKFADDQLHALQNQEMELKAVASNYSPAQIEHKIAELLEEIDCTESEIKKLLENNKEIGKKAYEIDDEISEKNMLQNRYKALQSQYRSDLKRLTFMVEGEIRKKDYEILAPKECPFCGNYITDSTVDDSCIEAAKAEMEKLKPKMMDLKSVQKGLKNELEELKAEREQLQSLMNELESQVKGELQPKVDQLRGALANYAIALTNYSKIEVLGKAQDTIRDNLIEFEAIPEPPYFPIDDEFDGVFIERFQKILTDILVACKYDRFREVSFDKKAFDVVINKTRKKSQGQGYRAFINVIVSMAMQEYLREYGKYHTDIFVVDSPILSLKEEVDKKSLASESMKSSLFRYFMEKPCAEQIIIIENEIPQGVDYSNAHMIEFTKDNGFWKTSPVDYEE